MNTIIGTMASLFAAVMGFKWLHHVISKRWFIRCIKCNKLIRTKNAVMICRMICLSLGYEPPCDPYCGKCAVEAKKVLW